MDVPCGSCRACCRSSYFIHVRGDETNTLKAIAAGLLMSAPGARAGDKVIGIASDGSCPMLSSGTCSIYMDRPQTCRDYDCRIFAAAGVEAGGKDKTAINRQAAAWRFRYASDADRGVHRAHHRCRDFLEDQPCQFPGSAGTNRTGRHRRTGDQGASRLPGRRRVDHGDGRHRQCRRRGKPGLRRGSAGPAQRLGGLTT
jgi:Fe-S-cluster containining protein